MKKMILVPSDFSSQSKSVDTLLKKLDIEMSEILNKNDIPMDVKLRQYNQALSRYTSLQHDKKEPYKLEISESSPVSIEDKEILQGIPKNNVAAAKSLLAFVKKNDRIQIDEKGEVTVDGTHLRGSNIIDLIHDLARNRKARILPIGLPEFAQALKVSNVPLEYIVNKNRKEMILNREEENADDDDDDNDFQDSFRYQDDDPFINYME